MLSPKHKASLILSLLLASLSAGCSHSTYIAPTDSYSATKNDVLVQQLQQQARHWQGVPYRYGGQDKSGIDCSAFIQSTFNTVMDYQIPRTTKEQIKLGKKIAPQDMQAGDLIFFKTGLKQRHIGIYIAQGEFLHASTSQGVTVSTMQNSYWRDSFWQSRRVLNEEENETLSTGTD